MHFYYLSLFLLLNVVISTCKGQHEDKVKYGVTAAVGLHADFLQENITKYRAGNDQFFGIWARFKGEHAVMAIEPGTGLSLVNYRYKMNDQGQILINHFAYLTTSLNIIFANDKQLFRPIAGLYIRNLLHSSLSVVERDNQYGGIHLRYSGELENFDKQDRPNNFIAGVSVGCSFQPKKIKQLSLEVIAQQDAISAYAKNHLFEYGLNGQSSREIRINGKPLSLSLKFKFRLI